MLRKLLEKCVNYETVSYIICGFLTTAVDFAVYALLRQIEIGVGLSQAMSWLAAVLFAYVVNKLIVFRNYNLRPSYLVKEVGAFVAARAFSGAVTWVLMVVMVKLGGDRGMLYELFCKFTSSVINMVLNYIFSKVFVFSEKEKAPVNPVKRNCCILGFAIPALTIALAFAVNQVFPFGDHGVLIIDSLHQYLPFFTEFHEKLEQGSSLRYHFGVGLGFNL